MKQYLQGKSWIDHDHQLLGYPVFRHTKDATNDHGPMRSGGSSGIGKAKMLAMLAMAKWGWVKTYQNPGALFTL